MNGRGQEEEACAGANATFRSFEHDGESDKNALYLHLFYTISSPPLIVIDFWTPLRVYEVCSAIQKVGARFSVAAVQMKNVHTSLC